MDQPIQGKIRCTEDQRLSVIDLISIITGEANPEQIWTEICQNHPDLANQCESYIFPNSSQELTPIASHKIALQIVDLLPDNFNLEQYQGVIHFLEKKQN